MLILYTTKGRLLQLPYIASIGGRAKRGKLWGDSEIPVFSHNKLWFETLALSNNHHQIYLLRKVRGLLDEIEMVLNYLKTFQNVIQNNLFIKMLMKSQPYIYAYHGVLTKLT